MVSRALLVLIFLGAFPFVAKAQNAGMSKQEAIENVQQGFCDFESVKTLAQAGAKKYLPLLRKAEKEEGCRPAVLAGQAMLGNQRALARVSCAILDSSDFVIVHEYWEYLADIGGWFAISTLLKLGSRESQFEVWGKNWHPMSDDLPPQGSPALWADETLRQLLPMANIPQLTEESTREMRIQQLDSWRSWINQRKATLVHRTPRLSGSKYRCPKKDEDYF
jgi:hypothetical protein